MSVYERILALNPAYDRRDEGYGIHGVDLLAVLKGPEGAVQFRLFTGWLLPETLGLASEPDPYGMSAIDYCDRWQERNMWRFERRARGHWPTPADLGYHSPHPLYDGQERVSETCEYVPGEGPCYYDGSGLNAIRPFYALLRGGSDGLFEYLVGYYHETFGVAVPA